MHLLVQACGSEFVTILLLLLVNSKGVVVAKDAFALIQELLPHPARDVLDGKLPCPVEVGHRVDLNGEKLRFLDLDLILQPLLHLGKVIVELLRGLWIPD